MPKLLLFHKHQKGQLSYPNALYIFNESTEATNSKQSNNYACGAVSQAVAQQLVSGQAQVKIKVNQKPAPSVGQVQPVHARQAAGIKAVLTRLPKQRSNGQWEASFRLMWTEAAPRRSQGMVYSVVVHVNDMLFGRTDYFPQLKRERGPSVARAAAVVPELIQTPIRRRRSRGVGLVAAPAVVPVAAPVAAVPVAVPVVPITAGRSLPRESRGMKRRTPDRTSDSTQGVPEVAAKRIKQEGDSLDWAINVDDEPRLHPDLVSLLQSRGDCHFRVLVAICRQESLYRVYDLDQLTKFNIDNIYKNVPCGVGNEFCKIVKTAKVIMSERKTMTDMSDDGDKGKERCPDQEEEEGQGDGEADVPTPSGQQHHPSSVYDDELPSYSTQPL